jgi:hypothetical protein
VGGGGVLLWIRDFDSSALVHGRDGGAIINPLGFSLMSDRSLYFFSLLLMQWTKRLMVPVAVPVCGDQVK